MHTSHHVIHTFVFYCHRNNMVVSVILVEKQGYQMHSCLWLPWNHDLQHYHIKPILSNTLYSLTCAYTKHCSNKRVLESCGNFTNFTTSLKLNDNNIVVTIATVHTILLKPFLWILTHVLGQYNFDLWQKTLKYREFSKIKFGYTHLGRHLEYLKLLKGDRSTPPQISLYTSQ